MQVTRIFAAAGCLLRSAIGMALIFAAISGGPASAAAPILLSDDATATEADIAIVLVHGLLGDPKTSFGDWPRIMAEDQDPLRTGRDMSDFAVYAVDYQASFKSKSAIEEIANLVATDLAASPIYTRHRFVVFVAHSLGGLIVKRVLATWRAQGKQLLIDRTLGIALLGVPSDGSPLADLAGKHGVDRIASLFGWDGHLVEELRTDSGSYLIALNSDWIAMKQQRDASGRRTPVTACGYETVAEVPALNLFLDTTVVARLYAGTTICDSAATGFPVRHTEINKPKRREDSQHLWLRAFLDTAISGGAREVNNHLEAGPMGPGSTLGHRVDILNEGLLPQRLDPATQLPVNPERIGYRSPEDEVEAGLLVYRGGPFQGQTKIAALQQLAAENTCVEVDPAPNGMSVSLAIDGAISCGNGFSVCAGQSCD